MMRLRRLFTAAWSLEPGADGADRTSLTHVASQARIGSRVEACLNGSRRALRSLRIVAQHCRCPSSKTRLLYSS